MSGPDADLACHAVCVLVGEAGVLIRGPSGSGKSSLGLALVAAAGAEGRYAALVADDRVRIARRHGRLVARPHPALAGLVEIRGHGIRPVAAAEAAVLRLVVDLVPALARLPGPEEAVTAILGLALPRLAADRGLLATGLVPGLVRAALAPAAEGRAERGFAAAHDGRARPGGRAL